MKILGVCGSPHANGNTAYALDACMEHLRGLGAETRVIRLSERSIEPCRGCFTCIRRECVIKDDMEETCEAMRDCDGLILASPVYFGLVSGLMKNWMDRTVALRASGMFQMSGKVGAGIACGNFRNGGQELTLQCMHTFLLQQDMLAVADGPEFCHSGAAIVGDARTDDLGLITVRHVADRVFRALSGKP